MTPVNASQKKNEAKVFANLYGDLIYLIPEKPKFAIGDKARISKYKRKVCDKGYTPIWTEEIFVVDEVLLTKPVTNKIVDLMGEVIEGSFYDQELQKAKQQTFRIGKVFSLICLNRLTLHKVLGQLFHPSFSLFCLFCQLVLPLFTRDKLVLNNQ